MRCFTCLFLLLLASTLGRVQAAPVPERKDAKPAVIDAGAEAGIAGVLEGVVWGARVGVRENEKVAGLELIRRQKDWESWLKKNLRLERVKDTNLVRVSFQDGSPEEQATIVNVVVDYYLKHDVASTRDSLTQSLKGTRDRYAALRRAGKVTEEELAKVEARLKKREEYIRTLPALVEHAKAR
jgi:hypothetical protein